MAQCANICVNQLSWCNLTPGASASANCTIWNPDLRCHQPIVGAPILTLTNPSCDPTIGSCSVGVRVPIDFPGNDQNWPGAGATTGIVNVPGVGTCGGAGASIETGRGEAGWLIESSCLDQPEDDLFSVIPESCPFINDCDQPVRVPVDVGLPGTPLCGAESPPAPCADNCVGCVAGRDGGGVPVTGGGASVAAETGPGAVLRHLAGGVGGVGFANAPTWSRDTGLARYWAHDYAERIVEDPDDGHVWMLAREGGFIEFTDTAPDPEDVYEEVAPSDEYRKLYRTTSGWELRDREGGVQTFEEMVGLPGVGLWVRTVDRNGNATVATYEVATRRLTAVTFPDGLREEFAYGYPGGPSGGVPGGMLWRIVEKGIDGSIKGTWTYHWTRVVGAELRADGLMRVDRPDGTRLHFFYNDARFPGYLTRLELDGTGGAPNRVIGAWAYDARGRVMDTWMGHTVTGLNGEDLPGTNAIEHFHLAFDTPAPGFTTVTYPEGAEIVYEVDADPVSSKPRVLSVSGTGCPLCGFGANSSFEYADAANPMRPTRVTDGEGNVTDFAYDANGMVVVKTEAANDPALTRTTTFEYHENFPSFETAVARPSVEPGFDRVTVSTYDSVTGDLLGRQEQGFEDNRPADECGSGNAFDCQTSYTYNDAGRIDTIDPPGHATEDVTSFAYPPDPDPRNGFYPESRTDPVGMTRFVYDAHNRRVRVTDVNAVDTDTCYDAMDRVTRVVQRALPGSTVCSAAQSGDLETVYQYTEFGDLARTILPRGNRIENGYDETGRLVSIERRADAATVVERVEYSLDDLGNRTLETLKRGDGSTTATTSFEYEGGCQLTKVMRGSGPGLTEYDYDCAGNLTAVWDAEHPRASFPMAPARYGYDTLNRLETVTELWGAGGADSVTAYEYDVQGHLVSVADAEGNITSYGYSDRDVLTEQTSVVSGTTLYSYDEHGELISETDARNVTVARVVDPADRLTLLDYADDALDVVYRWDDDPSDPGTPNLIGRLAEIERNGHTIEYRYDAFGRRIRDGELTYEPDANGNVVEIAYPGGVTANWTYDGVDRPASLIVDATPEPGGDQTVVSQAGYWPAGPLETLELGNGLEEHRAVDDRYFPSRIELVAAAARLDWVYVTDAVGNVVSIDDLLTSTSPIADRTFAYQDAQYFLTCAAGPWSSEDPTNDCRAEPPAGEPWQWTYDRIGNRLSEQRATAPEELGGRGVDIDSYVYEPNATAGNTPVLDEVHLGAGGTREYTFGSAGHLELLQAGVNWVDVTVNPAGRIGRFARSLEGGPALGVADVLYEGRGLLRRVTSLATGIFQDGFETGDTSCWGTVVTIGGEHRSRGACEPPPSTGPSVEPIYDSAGLVHVLQRADEGGPSSVYFFYLAGRPVAELLVEGATATWQFLTVDHLGTPIAGTDTGGALLWQGGLDPFGGAVDSGTPLRLPGQWVDDAWTDASSGLNPYYNVHRWYEPGTGRYTRPDPLATQRALRPYIYAKSRPLRYVDSLGLSECGPVPQRQPGQDCLAFCDALKDWAECALERQLKNIGTAGLGLAVIGGAASSFEFGPIGGCLVGGGLLLVDLAVHAAWESYGRGHVQLQHRRCRRNCQAEACVVPPPHGPFEGGEPVCSGT